MESKILKLLNLRLGLNNKKTEYEYEFDVTGLKLAWGKFNEAVYGLKKMLRFSYKFGLLLGFSRLFQLTEKFKTS